MTTTAGSRTSSWRRRYGAQAAISSGCGSRLSGGRHFTTFVMNTSSRCQPIDCEQPDQEPAGAADERPALAVLVEPGSLADEHHFGVGVALARHGSRPRPGQAAAVAGPDLRRDLLERPAALVRRHAGDPAVAPTAWRSEALRIQPRATSSSASSTAFDAAPLRRLSDTTQNASPRLPGIDGSWRTRPT